MINNKGQALVEFIIIIPIFLFILFAIVDIGNIIYQKYKLENDIDVIADMYISNENDKINAYLSSMNADVKFENNDKFITITLEKKININTIVLNNIIGHNYKISVDKTIYDGDNHE